MTRRRLADRAALDVTEGNQLHTLPVSLHPHPLNWAKLSYLTLFCVYACVSVCMCTYVFMYLRVCTYVSVCNYLLV